MRTEKEKLITELRKNYKKQVKVIETTYQPLNSLDIVDLRLIKFSLDNGNEEDIDTLLSY